MFDLKIIDKVRAKFQWSNNKKNVQKAKEAAQLAQTEAGQIIQLQITNHFDIKDVQQFAFHTNGDVPKLLQNATSRLALEQAVKQKNLEETVAIANLENIENPKPFEKDWFMEWMSIAQKISKDEIRNILATILRKEASDGHSTSLRTLEVLKTLEKDDLELFKLFCDISFCPEVPGGEKLTLVVAEPYDDSPAGNSMKEIGLSYENLTRLQDLGLIKSDLTSNHPGIGIVISSSIPYFIGSKIHVPTDKYVLVEDFRVKVILFTKVGLQLRECIDLGSNENYEEKFVDWVNTKFTKIAE